tara:strand:+ start:2662 stop:3603 length:942 start_codon:yes stop_codon:yes gene_type:complete
MSVCRLSKETGEATSQSKSRIEQVLLVGLENERAKRVISPSKPIGLFGGVQRKGNHHSTHLLETALKLRMFAVTEGFRTNANGDLAPFYDPAPYFESAQGIYAHISMGCFYRPDNTKNEEQMKNIALVGLRHAYSTASNLFVQSFREALGWHELANNLENSLTNRFSADNLNPPKVKIEALPVKPETYPDAHLLVPREAAMAEAERKNQMTNKTINGATVEASVWTYLRFNDTGFQITDPKDDGLAYAFPVEFEQYSSTLFDKLKGSDLKFGTVCLKGTQIELSYEQVADDVLSTNEKEAIDGISNMFANMSS